jgi:hypothetical protein
VNKVILNWQRPLWEGDREVVKRSGRDESVWVTIHMCMEEIFARKLAKMLSFLLSLMFSLQQNWRTRRQNRFCQEVG